jgi:Zn finger protein HypA/HybF involved in hydrogenase expression
LTLLNPLDFLAFWNVAKLVSIFQVDALPCTMEAVMPKCAGCGTETDLHELDVPICPSCVAERERLHSSIASLSAELTSARELYRKAMEEFNHHEAMCRGLPKGHPDRTVAAHLEEQAKTAGERYWEALRAYGDALRQGGG